MQPVDYPLRERRRELPHLLHGQSVHVEDDDGPGDLRFGFHHGRLQKQNDPLEHLVETALVVLPLLAEFQQEYPPPELVPLRQDRDYVLLEHVFLPARDQSLVYVAVLDLERVVPLDLERDGSETRECETCDATKAFAAGCRKNSTFDRRRRRPRAAEEPREGEQVANPPTGATAAADRSPSAETPHGRRTFAARRRGSSRPLAADMNLLPPSIYKTELVKRK